MLDGLVCLLIKFVNLLIRGVAEVFGWLLLLFPDTPFPDPEKMPDGGVNLGWITWLLDFPTWILHFALLLTAIATYYGVRMVARWVKVVRG